MRDSFATEKGRKTDRFALPFLIIIISRRTRKAAKAVAAGADCQWRFVPLFLFQGDSEMSYTYFNENPAGRSVGDCTVRALSKALGQTWAHTYVGLCLEGFMQGDLPNADDVYGRYLYRHGFRRHLIPDDGLGRYTVEDFAADHPEGVFVLSIPGRHVVTVVDGTYYDSWNSGGEAPGFYWTKEC